MELEPVVDLDFWRGASEGRKGPGVVVSERFSRFFFRAQEAGTGWGG
jgi:hypothetical protein